MFISCTVREGIVQKDEVHPGKLYSCARVCVRADWRNVQMMNYVRSLEFRRSGHRNRAKQPIADANHSVLNESAMVGESVDRSLVG